jgi:hypothetical protein
MMGGAATERRRTVRQLTKDVGVSLLVAVLAGAALVAGFYVFLYWPIG